MKSILGKALEQILMSIVKLAQDFPDYRSEFDKIKFQLRKRDGCLERIEYHLSCIAKPSEQAGTSVQEPALVDLASDPKEAE